jgi:arylformamidase
VIEVIGADRQVSREHLQGCELQPGERILLKTRNSRLPVARTFVSDFVALELSAAEHLAECQVRLVGVDGPSVDVWGASDFPCHKHLLGADIVILENLALCHVVPGIYGLIAMPLNLVGADGCPVRAVLTPLQGLPHLPA